VCGDGPDPQPDINKDDVSKEKGHSLEEGITPTDGQEALKPVGKKPRLLEAFETRTFEGVWPDVAGIQKDAAPPSVDSVWRSVGEQLHTSALNFEREVKRLKEGGGWEGETIEAAFTNAVNSISEPFYTGTAALRGAELVQRFRETMNYVFDHLVKDPLGEYDTMKQRYDFDVNNKEQYTETAPGQSGVYYVDTTESEKAVIRQYYDEYMRLVMNESYKPGITDIYGHYPQFVENTAPAKPIDIPGLPEDPRKPKDDGGGRSTGDGGGTPPFGGGGLPSGGGGGTPSIPKTPGLPLPQGLPDQTRLPSPGDTNDPGQSTGQGQNDQRPSLTDPSQAMGQASGLANAANQAVGSATQAAKAQPGGPPKGLGQKPNLPREGALRLGNEGKGGPGSGARGGGGSGGAGLGGMPKGLPGMPAAATQASAAGASGPGMGSAAPMMGPPGTPGSAGHGAGGAQQGKEHKVNKALRSRRHGIEIAGEAEAVVPVVGQDQDQDQQQDEAAAQRGSDRSRGPSNPSPAAPKPAGDHEGRQLRGRA
jgi:uncharacterized membrane protein YgcG